MKIFAHGNFTIEHCPICDTQDDKPVALLGIVGTEQGNNMEAKQVHVECLDLLYYPESGIIAQSLNVKGSR